MTMYDFQVDGSNYERAQGLISGGDSPSLAYALLAVVDELGRINDKLEELVRSNDVIAQALDVSVWPVIVERRGIEE